MTDRLQRTPSPPAHRLSGNIHLLTTATYFSPLFRALLLASLVAAVALDAPLSAQVSPTEREQAMKDARVHVEAQRFDEAQKIFQYLVDRNPNDLEARTWVARLEGWQKNYPRAEKLYRAVLADAPSNVEATLGLADVLGWTARYQEGLALLEDLLTEKPEDVEVLIRLGRIHRWQNHRGKALYYYRQVLIRDPSNQEADDTIKILTQQKSFRFETGYFLEDFDFASNTNGHFVQLLYRDFDRLTLLGRLQFQNKFDQNNVRATFGATYRLGQRTWLRGEISGAPPNDTVIANSDFTAELVQGLPGRIALGGSYRFLDFETADVQVLTVIVNWDPNPNFHLYLRYNPARTEFRQTNQSIWNQNGWVRLVWDAHRNLSPYALFSVGAESFEGFSTDRLGSFSAQTYGGGAEVRFADSHGIRLGYYLQNRTQGRRQQGFNLSYFLDF